MTNDALLSLAMMLKDTGYSFTTVTPATHARVNARATNAWARNTTDVFGWNRPFREGVLPSRLFESMRDADVLQKQGEGWISRVRASTLCGQLFLHSAYPTSTSDAIFFGPDSYRFANAITRYLSGNSASGKSASGKSASGNTLSGNATGDKSVRRAVDIGCGAGPGAVVIGLERPQADVFAVDINPIALGYTSVNASVAGASQVIAQQSNLLDGIEGDFDLIVANPPYLLDAQERTYRHGGGSCGEGLSLAIAGLARTRLAPGGTLLLYTGSAIVDGTDQFLASVGPVLRHSALEWDYEELDPDVFGEELDQPAYAETDRIAAVLLTVQRASGDTSDRSPD